MLVLSTNHPFIISFEVQTTPLSLVWSANHPFTDSQLEVEITFFFVN